MEDKPPVIILTVGRESFVVLQRLPQLVTEHDLADNQPYNVTIQALSPHDEKSLQRRRPLAANLCPGTCCRVADAAGASAPAGVAALAGAGGAAGGRSSAIMTVSLTRSLFHGCMAANAASAMADVAAAGAAGRGGPAGRPVAAAHERRGLRSHSLS